METLTEEKYEVALQASHDFTHILIKCTHTTEELVRNETYLNTSRMRQRKPAYTNLSYSLSFLYLKILLCSYSPCPCIISIHICHTVLVDIWMYVYDKLLRKVEYNSTVTQTYTASHVLCSISCRVPRLTPKFQSNYVSFTRYFSVYYVKYSYDSHLTLLEEFEYIS